MERITASTPPNQVAELVSSGSLHVADKATAKRVLTTKINEYLCMMNDDGITAEERESIRTRKQYYVQIRREI